MVAPAHDTLDARWGSETIVTSAWSLPALKANYVLKHLPSQGRVLEVGSGEGRILKTVAQHSSVLSLHGCDVREPAAPAAGYEFRLMTTDSLPFEAFEFDVVIMVDVLEHVADPAHLLREIRRVLVSAGTLIGFVPVEGERWSAYTLMRALFGWDLFVTTKHHIQAFTHQDLRRLVDLEFSVVDWRYAYHGVGQSLDAAFFALSRLKPVNQYWWQQNPYYRSKLDRASFLARVFKPALGAGNALAFAESRLLERIKLGAAGVLFCAKAH